MASPFQTDEDLNDGQNKQNANTSDSPKALGGETAVISQGSAPKTGQSNSSGQFTNLQNYLDQNQSAGFGSELAGKVGQQSQNAESIQGQSGQNFQNQVNQGSVIPDKGFIENTLANPTEAAQNPDTLKQFQNIYNAKYNGPQDFNSGEDYQKAYSATQNAQSQADLSQTEQGRNALIGQYYSRPNYTQGQKNLDQLLAANDPNAKAGFEQARNSAGQATKDFSSLTDQMNQYAQQQQQATQSGAQQAQQQSGEALTNQKNSINAYALPAYQNELNTIQGLTTGLNSRDLSQLTPEQQKALGLQSGQSLYKADLSKYITPDQVDSFQNYVNPEDYSKYQALSQLTGQQNQFLPDQSKIGTEIGKQGYNFEKDKFNKYIQDQQSGLQKDLSSTYFDPFSSSTNPEPGQYGYFYSGPNSQGRGYNIQDPQIQKELDYASKSSPNDAAMRQQESKEVQDKIRAIQNQYGLYDTLKG